jgi:hypothetical protein
MTTVRTLADPLFNSIINRGEPTMNNESNAIDCQTGEERPSTYTPTASTTLINPSLCESTQTQPIQGVSGATYAPMDTSPKTPEQDQNARVKMLMDMLTTTLNQLVKELQAPTQPQTDLEEAVNTMLENAEWFDGRVANYLDEKVEEHIDGRDFDYEIGQAVAEEMRSFDPNDHVDFYDLVSDAVDDKLESIVEEKLEALLEEKLANARITVNF